MSPAVKTRQGSEAGQYWRYLQTNRPEFNAIVFDEQALSQQSLIEGSALAGRGNTLFLNVDGQALVLRHYRRGGLVRYLSSRYYFYTGLEKTRAMREFDVLCHLKAHALPAPPPYACQVIRRWGALYQASLVTHRLSGQTLAQRLVHGVAALEWQAMGETIARFHLRGVYHADLNAHNIMIDDTGVVSLIDFDRAEVRSLSPSQGTRSWCFANISRLERSINKVLAQHAAKGSERDLIVTANRSTDSRGVEQLLSHVQTEAGASRAEPAADALDAQQGMTLLIRRWREVLTP